MKKNSGSETYFLVVGIVVIIGFIYLLMNYDPTEKFEVSKENFSGCHCDGESDGDHSHFTDYEKFSSHGGCGSKGVSGFTDYENFSSHGGCGSKGVSGFTDYENFTGCPGHKGVSTFTNYEKFACGAKGDHFTNYENFTGCPGHKGVSTFTNYEKFACGAKGDHFTNYENFENPTNENIRKVKEAGWIESGVLVDGKKQWLHPILEISSFSPWKQ